MIPEELTLKLLSGRSADRKRAAKLIGKAKLTALSQHLFSAYTKEKTDTRAMETQAEMIRAIGMLCYKPALPEMEALIIQNRPHDLLTISAASTYVQLKRISLYDGQPVLHLLNTGSVAVVTGALMVLNTDKMIPEREDIKNIIRACWDINKHKDRIGYEYQLIDPRHYLASACANWDKQLTTGFLHHCITTAYNINCQGIPVENKQLKDICKKSLSGKQTRQLRMTNYE
jgi:hypothetical protein